MTTMIGKICITLAILAPAAALAAPQSVTESARYALADTDSRNDARQICASTAKRTALDKAGSLFESDLTAHKAEANGKLTDDTRLQMRSYVAAVVGSEVVGEHFDVSGDRLIVSCTVRITFDPDEVRGKLQDIAGNADLRQKLAAQQAQMDILESELHKLSTSVASSQPDRAAAPQPQLSGMPNQALPQSPPTPQIAQAPADPPPASPEHLLMWPNTSIPVTMHVPAPPAPVQVPYQTAAVYPPPPPPRPPAPVSYYYRPAPVYYYYRPVPAYPRVAYGGWYYAPQPRW